MTTRVLTSLDDDNEHPASISLCRPRIVRQSQHDVELARCEAERDAALQERDLLREQLNDVRARLMAMERELEHLRTITAADRQRLSRAAEVMDRVVQQAPPLELIAIRMASREVWWHGQRIVLPRGQFALLLELLREPWRRSSAEVGAALTVSGSAVRMMVTRMRDALQRQGVSLDDLVESFMADGSGAMGGGYRRRVGVEVIDS